MRNFKIGRGKRGANRPLRICQSILLISILALACLSSAGSAQRDEKYEKYLAEIRALERERVTLLRKEGKQALIARYRDLIANNPGYDENLLLESQIAWVYERHLPDNDEPRDYKRAWEYYKSALKRYEKSNPYMKEVKRRAANRGADLDPLESDRLYMELIEENPNDDVTRLDAYCSLGLSAAKRNDAEVSEGFYSLLLMYEPVDMRRSKALSRIQAARQNAAIGLFWVAATPPDPSKSPDPGMQLASIRAMLKKYPQIEMWHGDIVYPHLERLEQQVKKEIYDEVGIPSVDMKVAGGGTKPKQRPEVQATPGKTPPRRATESPPLTTQTTVVQNPSRVTSSSSPGGNKWLLVGLLGLAGVGVIWMVVLYVRQ